MTALPNQRASGTYAATGGFWWVMETGMASVQASVGCVGSHILQGLNTQTDGKSVVLPPVVCKTCDKEFANCKGHRNQDCQKVGRSVGRHPWQWRGRGKEKRAATTGTHGKGTRTARWRHRCQLFLFAFDASRLLLSVFDFPKVECLAQENGDHACSTL